MPLLLRDRATKPADMSLRLLPVRHDVRIFIISALYRSVEAWSVLCIMITAAWDVAQVKALGLEVGVRFMALGFDPTTASEDVPIMPKNRYDIMRAYMPTRGTLGLDMMLRSCTIQVRSHTPPPPPHTRVCSTGWAGFSVVRCRAAGDK